MYRRGHTTRVASHYRQFRRHDRTACSVLRTSRQKENNDRSQRGEMTEKTCAKATRQPDRHNNNNNEKESTNATNPAKDQPCSTTQTSQRPAVTKTKFVLKTPPRTSRGIAATRDHLEGLPSAKRDDETRVTGRQNCCKF